MPNNNTLGWKVAFWSLGVLQTIAVTLLVFLLSSVIDLKERMAKIEGRLNTRFAQVESVLSTIVSDP